MIVACSDLFNITFSPFWHVLRQSLQTLVGRRSPDIPEHRPHCSPEEAHALYDTPCVVKSPKPGTKKIDLSFRPMTQHQHFLLHRFLKHAQRYYRFLQEIGVRKDDPSRNELHLLLVDDPGDNRDWEYQWEDCRPDYLNVQVTVLEKGMLPSSSQVGTYSM